MTANRFAQLVEHRTIMQKVGGLNPGRTNTQGLKITELEVVSFVISSANG